MFCKACIAGNLSTITVIHQAYINQYIDISSMAEVICIMYMKSLEFINNYNIHICTYCNVAQILRMDYCNTLTEHNISTLKYKKPTKLNRTSGKERTKYYIT